MSFWTQIISRRVQGEKRFILTQNTSINIDIEGFLKSENYSNLCCCNPILTSYIYIYIYIYILLKLENPKKICSLLYPSNLHTYHRRWFWHQEVPDLALQSYISLQSYTPESCHLSPQCTPHSCCWFFLVILVISLFSFCVSRNLENY